MKSNVDSLRTMAHLLLPLPCKPTLRQNQKSHFWAYPHKQLLSANKMKTNQIK